MTYNQFVQAVELKVKEVIDEDIKVSIFTAEKNNGVIRKGITISRDEINISPTIYLEEYFEQFQKGSQIDQIVMDIIRLYHEVKFQKSWEEESIYSYKNVEHKIVYRLINYSENKELLLQVPHVCFLDLAIVFYVLMDVTEHGMASMLIRHEHLDMWEVDSMTIFKQASRNTERLLPYEFCTMCAMLEKMTGEEFLIEKDVLYVLSNKLCSFGAAAILYEDRLKKIAEYLNDNYYVLPSSIHEVLIVPERQSPCDIYGLSEMVSEINRTQMMEEEVLSDNVYYYDRLEEKLL